jgi:hypothetical protein
MYVENEETPVITLKQLRASIKPKPARLQQRELCVLHLSHHESDVRLE